jgi:5-oxoprolinase (ATP-hydrolysing)
MTNTRITDPEILESRYPVVLEEFAIRKGSGGIGKFNGGDGLVRIFKFLDDLNLSVLTERRGSYRPYGLEGGAEGAPGENYLQKINGQLVNLSAKNSLQVHPGERLILKTPGGGGFGNRNFPL